MFISAGNMWGKVEDENTPHIFERVKCYASAYAHEKKQGDTDRLLEERGINFTLLLKNAFDLGMSTHEMTLDGIDFCVFAHNNQKLHFFEFHKDMIPPHPTIFNHPNKPSNVIHIVHMKTVRDIENVAITLKSNAPDPSRLLMAGDPLTYEIPGYGEVDMGEVVRGIMRSD